VRHATIAGQTELWKWRAAINGEQASALISQVVVDGGHLQLHAGEDLRDRGERGWAGGWGSVGERAGDVHQDARRRNVGGGGWDRRRWALVVLAVAASMIGKVSDTKLVRRRPLLLRAYGGE